ncbi:hypothetical protein KKB84_08495 [bacterium]|nr:hypothetical protein [bacterium]
MKKFYSHILAIVCVGLICGCAGLSSHINLPESPAISTQSQVLKKCILVSRFGATTGADKELAPQLLQAIPEVFKQQCAFAEVRLESEEKC